MLASAYSTDLNDSFSYTPEQLADYYSEHAAEYDTYYYYNYPINSSDKPFEDLEGDELKEKAKQCKTMEELTALAAKEGIELPDEVVDQIAGGCGMTCIDTPACPGFG